MATTLYRRQVLSPTSTATSISTSRTMHPHCTPFSLPSGGHFQVNPTSIITLASDILFTPECHSSYSATASFTDTGVSGVSDVKDPFYASETPQVYATAAATVVAWMLVIMLVITPKTYFVGGSMGGYGILNRHGLISGAQGGASPMSVGSRPWLQKVAALTVAVSLTIATADTFRVAEQQYAEGVMNAEKLRAEVVGSTEIKITRIISDVFLWLAQVQTLVRLFGRHKEKVMIKWIGFALIILDATFSCLNSFMGNPIGRPKRFRDAIPALSYLFQLALSMLYAAWVIYYAFRKRRFAFYHKDMWNISLVALLSFVAILTPVVFFITDISNSSVAGWGDYFRWVGAAAASVIVWEWVERIEALEREEKKDGILGREVFDGDDMMEETAESEEVIWPRQRRFWGGPGRRGGGGGAMVFTSGQDHDRDGAPPHLHHRASERYRQTALARSASKRLPRTNGSDDVRLPGNVPNPIATPPPVAITPVSRTDTTSPSTVYTVRYHTQPLPPVTRPQYHSLNQTVRNQPSEQEATEEKTYFEDYENIKVPDVGTEARRDDSRSRFHISNPFKRRKALPPEEVRAGQVIDPVSITSPRSHLQIAHDYEPWDIKGRLGAFAADQGEKWRERKRGHGDKDKDLPVTIIPAQPRGRTWSPDATLNLPRGQQTVDTVLTQRSSGATAVDSGDSSKAEGLATANSPGPNPFAVVLNGSHGNQTVEPQTTTAVSAESLSHDPPRQERGTTPPP